MNFKLAIKGICLLFLFSTFSANSQDTTNNNIKCDFTIQKTRDNAFIMNGQQISFDSCKQRLSMFEQSFLELKRASKFKEQKLALAFCKYLAFPTATAGYVNGATNSKFSWLNTTTICLGVPFLVSVFYIMRAFHLYQVHLKKSIDKYNIEILKLNK